MSVIKMYVASSGTALTSASIDVPADGIITAITLGLQIEDASPVITEGSVAEVSFLSSQTFATNDARGSLCAVGRATAFADAARLVIEGSGFCVLTPIHVPVNAGERIYLHIQSDGSVVATAVAYLFVSDGLDQARPRITRR